MLLMQVFLTPQYLAIAMEYVPGGDMFEFVVSKKGLKESEARYIFSHGSPLPLALGENFRGSASWD